MLTLLTLHGENFSDWKHERMKRIPCVDHIFHKKEYADITRRVRKLPLEYGKRIFLTEKIKNSKGRLMGAKILKKSCTGRKKLKVAPLFCLIKLTSVFFCTHRCILHLEATQKLHKNDQKFA